MYGVSSASLTNTTSTPATGGNGNSSVGGAANALGGSCHPVSAGTLYHNNHLGSVHPATSGGSTGHPTLNLNFTNGGLVAPLTSCPPPPPSIATSNTTNGSSSASGAPTGNFFLMPAAQYGMFQGDLVPPNAIGQNILVENDSPKSYRLQAASSDKSAVYSMGIQIGSYNTAILPVQMTHERNSAILDHYEDLPDEIPPALAQEYQIKGC